MLSPTLLRLEYSPSGTFENSPTVNAIDRRMPVPAYSAGVSGGWLTVRTSQATLRYKVGSGPFTALNTTLRFADGGAQTTVRPTWDWECPFDQTCQAGAASLAGGATLSYDQGGYQSSAGYVGELDQGASATWSVLGAPAGRSALSFRYADVTTLGSSSPPRTIDLVVDGRRLTTLEAAPTHSAQPWATLTTTASLGAGPNSVQLRCDRGDSCGVDLDTLSTAPVDTPHIRPADRPPRRLVPGIRHLHLRTAATVRGGDERGHVPEHVRALAHRRLARRGRLAVARRHPERALDTPGMGPAPTARRRRRGRLPLRLRS